MPFATRFLLPLALLATPLLAEDPPFEWGGDADSALRTVRTGYYVNWLRSAVPTSDGGMIVVWGDARGGNFDVYAQKLHPEAQALRWGNGAPLQISGELDQQAEPLAISDGNGGAFVVWFDFRDGSGGGSLYINRIMDEGEQGSVLWNQDLLLHQGGLIDSDYLAGDLKGVPDGEGGCWIAWTDLRNSDWDLFLARLGPDGSMDEIYQDGLAISTAPGSQSSLRLEPDGNGGVWLAWIDTRNGPDGDVYAQHVSAAGGITGAENGVLVQGGSGFQLEPALAADGSGAWLAWTDRTTDFFGDLRMQRLDAALQSQLSDTQSRIAAQPGVRESASALAVTQPGECLVVWEDSRNEEGSQEADLYMQRVLQSGETLFEEGGRGLALVPGIQEDPRILQEQDRVYIAWQDRRFEPRSNVYVQALESDWQTAWAENGVALQLEESQTRASEVILSPAGEGLQALWFDEMRGAPGLRYQVLDSDGARMKAEEGAEIVWGPAGDAWGLQLADNGNGVLAGWVESTTWAGADKLMLQFIESSDGQLQLEAAGRVLFPDIEERTQSYVIHKAEDGSFYVAAELGDYLSQRAWLHHLDAWGNPLWPEPVSACETFDESGQSGHYQRNLRLASHPDGGVLLGWDGNWGASESLYGDLGLQAFSATGERLWGSEGLRITDSPLVAEGLEHMLIQGGEAVLFYSVQDLANRLYYYQRITASNGGILSGGTIIESEGRRRQLQVARLAGGDLACVWQNLEDDGRNSLQGLALDAEWNTAWTQEFSGIGNSFDRHVLVPDPWGGLIIASSELDMAFDSRVGVRHVLADGSLRWETAEAVLRPDEGRETEPALQLWGSGEDTRAALAFIRKNPDGTGDRLYIGGHELATADPAEPPRLWHGTFYANTELRDLRETAMTAAGASGAYLGWIEQIRLRTQCCIQPIKNIHLLRLGETSTSVGGDALLLPQSLALRSAPNPFNPVTRIDFQLAAPATVHLALYDLRGRLVRELIQGTPLLQGTHSLTLDGSGLASGSYFLSLQAGEQQMHHKVLLVK